MEAAAVLPEGRIAPEDLVSELVVSNEWSTH